MKRFKRFLAVFMTLAMILSFMPAMAFADDWSATGSGEYVDGTYQTEYTGSPVLLTVTVTGNKGTLTYVWEHEFHDNQGSYIQTIQTGTDPSLTADESGWYGCSIYDDGDYQEQIIFRVYKKGQGSDQWSVYGNGEFRNGTYYVQLSNGAAELHAYIDGSSNNPEYQWKRQVEVVGGTEIQEIQGATGPTIEVIKTGWYCCGVYNNGEYNEVYFVVDNDDQGSSGLLVEGSGKYINGSFQTEYTGSPVVLEIIRTVYSGNLRYEWEHEFHNDQGTYIQMIQDGSSPSVTVNEPGWYGCNIYVDGEYKLQVTFIVYTNDPGYGGGDNDWEPTGNGECRDGMYYVKMSGGTAHLEVTINGNNDSPSYKWLHEIVNDEGSEIQVIQGETGSSIDVSETGWYCCYVYKNGGEEREIDFRVYNPRKISGAYVPKIASQTYSGKAKTPKPIVEYDGFGTLVRGTDYTVSYKNNTNAGKATVTITGKGLFTGTKTVYFTINKAAITIKGKTVSLKASALKKKAQTISKTSAYSITKNDGKVTYKLASVSSSKYKKYFSVNSTSGKITVKKGLKKGTYKVKVKITAKGDKNHKAATKTVTVTVKVK